MNITQLKTVLPFLIKARLVPNIIGKHGIGKSSVISQYSKENGYSFHPYFLGQMSDVGDLLGLPEFDRDSKGRAVSTSFIHPAKLPKKPRSILFFDELNRASKDLIQAIFQLALEGTIHDYTLPEDSTIIMAMNPATDDYSVLDFSDKAFSDRFVHINLEPTHEEFHSYMKTKYGNSKVSDFLRQQTKLLEDSDLKNVSLDFVSPSRRSWDRLQVLEQTGIPDDLFKEVGMGIVGTAAMISYSSWRENQVSILNGSDILDSYSTNRNTFVSYFKDTSGALLENPRTDIVSSVSSFVVEELNNRLTKDTLTLQNAENLAQFLIDCPVEITYATLLPFRSMAEFALNKHISEVLTSNDAIIDKVLEAKKAKDAYLESNNKNNKLNIDDIPF